MAIKQSWFSKNLSKSRRFSKTADIARWFDQRYETVASQSRLHLRNTQANAIGANYYDWLTVAGTIADTAVVNTTVAGSAIPFTKTAGGANIKWITQRLGVGGATITSHDISLWGLESSALINAGFSYRLFKRAVGGTETALGSAIPAGVELTTASVNYFWFGGSVSYALLEDERLGLEVLADNIGVMTAGTATLNFNGGTLASTVTTTGAAYANATLVNHTVNSGNANIPSDCDYLPLSIEWAYNSPNNIVSVTVGGVAASLVAGTNGVARSFAGLSHRVECYELKAPPTGASVAVVITFNSNAGISQVAAQPFKNVNQTSPSEGGQNVYTSTATTNLAAAPSTTTVNGDYLFGCATVDSSSGTQLSCNDVEIGELDYNVWHSAVSNQGIAASTGAGNTLDWTGTLAFSWMTSVFAIKAASTTANSYVNVYPAIAFKAEGGATNINATLGDLSLTGLSATVDKQVNITGTLGALSLTGLQATVNNTRNINATLGALSLTGLSANVDKQTTITASLGQLNLSGLIAQVDNSTNIAASLGALSLTGLPANVTTGTSINASLGQLNLTGLSANIDKQTTIAANIGQLNLTGLSAQVDKQVNISAGFGALSLTGLSATIATPVTITASLGQLNLAGLLATVTNVGNVTINATLGQLNLIGLVADVTNGSSGDAGNNYYIIEHRRRLGR